MGAARLHAAGIRISLFVDPLLEQIDAAELTPGELSARDGDGRSLARLEVRLASLVPYQMTSMVAMPSRKASTTPAPPSVTANARASA